MEAPLASYMAPLKKLRTMKALATPLLTSGLEPFGNFAPVFNPPAGFTLRLGASWNPNITDVEFSNGEGARHELVGLRKARWRRIEGTPALWPFAVHRPQ